MKNFLFLLLLTTFLGLRAEGQGFFKYLVPPNARKSIEEVKNYSHPRPHFNAAKIIGVTSVSAGGCVGLFGLWLYVATDGESGNLNIAGAGAAMVLTGVGLIIGGSIHDHRHKWNMVAPKKNEVGFAYNF